MKNNRNKLGSAEVRQRKLLSGFSHELRTPLTIIRGEAEIALRGPDRTAAEYREVLDRIIEQSDRASCLIQDFSFIVRADADEARLQTRSMSLDSLLGSICDEYNATTELSVEQTWTDLAARVMGDAARLRQVFSILIENAIRYSEAGDKVEVGLERNDMEVIVTVRDHGSGLTAEEARSAFERFSHVGQTQGRTQGSGLGLPVAKAIIEAHGGRICLEGKPGDGALATVVLPLEDMIKAVT